MKKIGVVYLICAVLCAVSLILTFNKPIFEGQMVVLVSALIVSAYSGVLFLFGKRNKTENQQKVDFWGGILVVLALIVGIVYVLFVRK